MLIRILSAAVVIPIGIFILWLDNSLVFIAAISLISSVATYEILVATKYINNKVVSVISIAFSATVPVALSYEVFQNNSVILCFSFLLFLFISLIFMHEKMRFEQMIVIAFLSIFIPFALSSITLLQIRFEQHGIFYIVFMLISAWIGDAGAYFIGTFFGKHKMAPKISPKKSWEGFFGGLFTSALFGVFLGLGYEWYLKSIEGFQTVEVDILFLCISALICSILGVVGDFSASIIKRQCSVKDFGHILPGHGGVLDRFDSVMFVAPFTYILFTNFSPIIAV